MAGSQQDAKVWDLPVRLFHWLLPVGLTAQWYTAEEGLFETHETIGIAILTLIVFRILWGFFGSETARFAHFLRGPGAVLAQIRGGARPRLGHDAAGGWMIVLLLAALTAQATMGLFAVDDVGLFYAPLSGLVSQDMSETLAHWHHEWFEIILIFVGIHVLAVLFYALVRRERLIRPMITGRKPDAGPQVDLAPPVRAAILLALAAALTWGGIAALESLA